MVPFGDVEASRVSAHHSHSERLLGDLFRALLARRPVRLGVLRHDFDLVLGRRSRRSHCRLFYGSTLRRRLPLPVATGSQQISISISYAFTLTDGEAELLLLTLRVFLENNTKSQTILLVSTLVKLFWYPATQDQQTRF